MTRWDRGHEVFSTLESGGRLTLNSVQYSAFSELTPNDDAIVIASLEEGSPMMVQTPAADGRLIVFASAVDRSAWNDLRFKSTSFVPLMHETARFLASYRDSAPYYELGETVPVPEAGTLTTAVITPDDERLTLSEGGAEGQQFFTPEQSGFHELRVGPDVLPIAVNVASGESLLETMPPEDLYASVQRREGEVRSGAMLAETDATNYAERQNLWWYLLLFALLAGIGEIYLGNRVTEDVRVRRPAPSTT